MSEALAENWERTLSIFLQNCSQTCVNFGSGVKVDFHFFIGIHGVRTHSPTLNLEITESPYLLICGDLRFFEHSSVISIFNSSTPLPRNKSIVLRQKYLLPYITTKVLPYIRWTSIQLPLLTSPSRKAG